MSHHTEVLAEGVTCILGDCREWLDAAPPCFRVNAIVTSPPYGAIRDYGAQGTKPYDCIPSIARSVDCGGVCVWNVADQTINGTETGESFRHALAFMDAGLRLHDTMIYCKEGVTFPHANRYHSAFEYMFVFSQDAPRHFNGIRDWRNKWAGHAIHGTDRNTDGTTSTKNSIGNISPVFGLRRNWWVMSNPYTDDADGHPAPMPFSMASDHITTWTQPGETVFDPFTGSGTTGIAAVKLGRKFIGIEIEPKYFDTACRRISEALKQPNLPGLDPGLTQPVRKVI